LSWMAWARRSAGLSGADALGRHGARSVDPGEERTRNRGAGREPSVECPDGIGLAELPSGDADELPVAVLVCPGTADGHEDAGGLGDDVGAVECGELLPPGQIRLSQPSIGVGLAMRPLSQPPRRPRALDA
jgi:hypothetical protein